MGARSKARKRALDVLYEADQRGTDPLETLRERLAQSDPPVPEYAVTLVEGVVANRVRIDELLETYAQEWTIDRFPAVDRINWSELEICDDLAEKEWPTEIKSRKGTTLLPQAYLKKWERQHYRWREIRETYHDG